MRWRHLRNGVIILLLGWVSLGAFAYAENPDPDRIPLRVQLRVHQVCERVSPSEFPGDRNLSLDDLVKMLACPNARIRCAAAYALGEVKDPLSLDPLIKALDDPVPAVRRNTIRAIGKIGDPEAIPVLIERLNREFESDLSVRSMAASALGMIGDNQALVPLTQAATREDGMLACEACKALTRISHQEHSVCCLTY